MATIQEAFTLALEHQQAGRHAEAEDVYGRILAVRPDLVEVRFNYGFAQQMQGKLAPAIDAYHAVLRQRPDFVPAYAKLGDSLFWIGRLGGAIDAYEAASALAPDDGGLRAARDNIRRIHSEHLLLLDRLNTGQRFDLRDVTFMIPCRLESADRRRNLRVLLSYLTRYLDTNIIICEDNPEGQEVPALTDAMGLARTAYTYIHLAGNDTPFTHKSKQINVMAEAATTPIVVVQDTDVVVEPTQYPFARNAVRAGAAMACPFNGLFYDIGPDYVATVEKHLSVAALDLLDPRNELLYKNSYAGTVFFDRAVFTRHGGFNENFMSWGWEDFEIFQRLEKLGLRVERLWGPVLHLSHSRATNSLKGNPCYDDNTREYARVMAMDKAAIEAAIADGSFRRPLISRANLPAANQALEDVTP